MFFKILIYLIVLLITFLGSLRGLFYIIIGSTPENIRNEILLNLSVIMSGIIALFVDDYINNSKNESFNKIE